MPTAAPDPVLAPGPARRITIVGGGFSGASAAVQLVRRAQVPLAITVVEPRAELGRGLAYSATDPDHRLNATTVSHSMLPELPLHFVQWCEAQRLFEHDPQALWPNGAAFARRSDYGRYLVHTVQAHARGGPQGSTITHLQARAVQVERGDGTVRVHTDRGATLASQMLVLATGNAPPRLQPPFDPALADHPAVLANPLDSARLKQVDPAARVLLVGSGLTALDVASTLLRQGHRGGITVVSRRGLRPRPQAPEVLAPPVPGAAPAPALSPLARMAADLPAYIDAQAQAPTVRGWTRGLRQRLAAVQARGLSWQVGFDELRDVVWRAWPLLPPAQQRRFLRRLRTWYDVHRFRSPPMNDLIVDQGIAEGRIAYRAARVRSVAAGAAGQPLQVALSAPGQDLARSEAFDVVVNCSGLDPSAGVRGHPLLQHLEGQGWLRPDACGLGFEVNPHGSAMGADGHIQPWLRLFGPPTAGTFGDPLGALFIAVQIHRALPDLLQALAMAPAPAEA